MKTKRALSLILTLCLFLAMIPFSGAAAVREPVTTADVVPQPYAYSLENYSTTYMALGDSLTLDYTFSTGNTGGGYYSRLYRTSLTGSETPDELVAKATSLLKSGAKRTELGGGHVYSAPVEFTLSETINADDYGVGTYLFVCATYNTNKKINYNSICAVAIHVVKDPVPATGVEYYLFDENAEFIGMIDDTTDFTVTLGDVHYLYVALYPTNTTYRVERLGSAFTNSDEAADFFFLDGLGEGVFSVIPQYCGEGYIYTVCDTGDPDAFAEGAAFNATVLCKVSDTMVQVKDPTCTEDGLGEYRCEQYHHCGTVFSTEVIPATGHKWRFVSAEKEATWDEDGSELYRCNVCGEYNYVTIPALSTPPAKPHKITNVVSGVHVYWTAFDGAEKYGIWRSETGKDGTYKWIANPTVPHFTDTKVESGKTYFYKVTSMDSVLNLHSEKSEPIGIAFVSTPDITSRSNIAAGVALGWEKIEGATGYAIYRKSYSGSDAWARIGTIEGSDTLSWTDTSVKNNNGEAYKYTIRALCGSTLSGCRSAGRTMVRLSSQYIKSIEAPDSNSVKLSWSTSSRVTGYEVRFMVDGEVYKTFTIGNYKTGVKTFTGLKAGQTYTVQVRTYKKVDGVGSFYSDWSTAKTVKT